MNDKEHNPNQQEGIDASTPLMGDSLVLFLDVLGVSEMFSESIDVQKQEKNIERLYNVLDAVRGNLDIRRRNGVTVPDTLAAAMFSDSVYLVSAIGAKPTAFEGVLYGQFFKASECQTILLKHGFIARGGIARGLIAVENNFIAGPACVSAAKFETSGMPPVIMVDKQLLWDSYWGSCAMKGAILNPEFFLLDDSWYFKLLYDTKTDNFFFNYMEDWFALCTDSLSDGDPGCHRLLVENLLRHKRLIENMIVEFNEQAHQDEARSSVHEKYLFLANLHNFVLRTYAQHTEFSDVAQYVIAPPQPLPPTSIAWAYPYLKKFILEESYRHGHKNVDETFFMHHQ